ncbi:MAG: MFS transporter [Microthrixaceae bacterium]|nr:MFS transporter [Microthrixaceae bacterium]
MSGDGPQGAAPVGAGPGDPDGPERASGHPRGPRWSAAGEFLDGGPVLVLVVLFVLNAVDELTRTAFGVLAPDIASDLGTSLAGMFTVLALIAAVALGLQVPVAAAADRFNRVHLAVMGGVLMAVFTTLVGFSPNIWVLGLTMGAAGLGKSFIDPTHNSLLADTYAPHVRARVFAVHRGANAVGQFAGPLLAGFIAYAFSWRAPFIVFGPVILVAAAAALLITEPVRGRWERLSADAPEHLVELEEPPPTMAEAWRMCWKVDSLRRIYRTLPFLAPAVVGFVSFAAFLYADEFGLDERSRGVIASLSEPAQLVGLAIGATLGTRLFRRDPSAVFRFLGSVATAVALLALGFAFSPEWFVSVWEIRIPWVAVLFNMAISGSLAFLIPGIFAAIASAIPPRARATGFSMMSVFVIPGLVVLPLIGAVGDSLGMRVGMALMAPMFAIGGIAIGSAGGLLARDIEDVATASAARAEALHRRNEGRRQVLTVRNLEVGYGGVQVLFGVDLDVAEGEVLALLGTNGAGKSTLLRAISGITEADKGAVLLDGVDITHAPPEQVAARGIVTMPGGRGVFPGLTVAENLRAAAWLQRRAQRPLRTEAEAFEMFPPLERRRDEPAANLSGGQQQMLALAMALLARPRLLMIDELSLGLAPLVVEQLLEAVRSIAAAGTTVIVVEQSVNVALTLADRAYFMEKGEIRFEGPTADLLERPDLLRSVFFGEAGTVPAAGETVSPGVRPSPAKRGPSEPAGDEAPRPAALELEGIARRFGGILAVDRVGFAVGEGEILGLVGANGAGKTTLFDIISGFTAADEGCVRLRGVDITHMGPHLRARAGLGRSFQDAALFGGLTVQQALAVAHDTTTEVRNPLLEGLAMPAAFESEEAVRESVDSLIDSFGLERHRSRFVHELSTGTRRVVDLAALVALRPSVVLLDEPSSGIAQRESEALRGVITSMRDEFGFTILVIEHDMALLRAVADRLVALESGSVIAEGLPGEVLSDPAVIQSYLGGSATVLNRSGARPVGGGAP